MTGRADASLARSKGLRRLLREPLLQFMALGAVIFAVSGLLGGSDAERDRRIVVDGAVVGRLAALYEKQMGTSPDPAQLDSLVDNYIEEEVLYREALRLGLDGNDEIVRRRLVQKMRFLAARTFDEPSEDQLRAFYEARKVEFAEPSKVSFRHLYFSPDKGGTDAANSRAMDALNILNADCEIVEGTADGDAFPLQMQFSRLAPMDAVQLFGNSEMAKALFSTAPGGWSGPYASGYGAHLINISERREEHVPPFEEIREKVRAAYERDSSQRQTDEAITALSARYEIIRRGEDVSR